MNVSILPSNASGSKLEWSSSDSSIATVSSNGTITAYSTGTAVISAKTANGLIATSVYYSYKSSRSIMEWNLDSI